MPDSEVALELRFRIVATPDLEVATPDSESCTSQVARTTFGVAQEIQNLQNGNGSRTFNCSLNGQGLQWLHLEGMVHGQYVEDPKAPACSEEMACGCHPDIDVRCLNPLSLLFPMTLRRFFNV